jgi:hypothetical protein
MPRIEKRRQVAALQGASRETLTSGLGFLIFGPIRPASEAGSA